jgi:hypothetical protein
MSATCKGCGAPIIWATTDAGASMPLEREPVAAGMYRLTITKGQALAHFVPREMRHDNAPLFVAHWSRCPQAKEFRK